MKIDVPGINEPIRCHISALRFFATGWLFLLLFAVHQTHHLPRQKVKKKKKMQEKKTADIARELEFHDSL